MDIASVVSFFLLRPSFDGAFPLQTGRFENVGFAFWGGRKRFFKRSFSKVFENDDINHVSFKHKSKMASDCCVFKFLWSSTDGKLLIRFQSLVFRIEIPNFSGVVWTVTDI